MMPAEPARQSRSEGGYMAVRRALVSVCDTAGLVEFVNGLQRLGIDVVAVDETADWLQEQGVSVASLSQQVAEQALVGVGAAKTMHPGLRAALLHGAAPGGEDGADSEGFDIVVVNLEPFERVSGSRASRTHEIVEAIDVDGPAILRSAAKNFENVIVVADPDVYPLVIEELESTGGDVSWEARRLLASRAFDATAHYELSVASWFSEVEDFPVHLMRDYVKQMDLPYGENPHQRSAYYVEIGSRRHLLSMVEQVQGEAPSFNNLNDLNTGRHAVAEFTIPSCIIVKHGSPAGVAVSGDIAGAFERAFAANESSSYGGVLVVNRPVDMSTAKAIAGHYFELLFAPAILDDARAWLSEHCPDLRVMIDRERRKKSPGERDMRRVIGGLLVQDTDVDVDERDSMEIMTSVTPDERAWGDMLFAWRVAKWVRSNAIVLASDLTTVGIGGGTPSRHDGIEFALAKAGDRARGAMLASDGFLGYDDTVQTAIDAGIAGIIQPGGSRRDDEIVAKCEAAGIPMVFTHRRHFRS